MHYLIFHNLKEATAINEKLYSIFQKSWTKSGTKQYATILHNEKLKLFAIPVDKKFLEHFDIEQIKIAEKLDKSWFPNEEKKR